MAYLEELLPEFRKGAKIRCKNWGKDEYIQKKGGLVATENDFLCSLPASDIFSNRWELYNDPEPDWQYIIDNRCLCWFWDDNMFDRKISYLKKEIQDCRYNFLDIDKIWWKHCAPVSREEVTFYEDRKDEL